MDNVKELLEFEFNVDDMTGEAIAFAVDKLYGAGALDVYTVDVGMKKSRPGVLVHITLSEGRREEILRCVFKYTSTIGVRERKSLGYALNQRIETKKTSYGDVRLKISEGYGTVRKKYENADVQRVAETVGCTLDEAVRIIEKE